MCVCVSLCLVEALDKLLKVCLRKSLVKGQFTLTYILSFVFPFQACLNTVFSLGPSEKNIMSLSAFNLANPH